jgi:AcrR family transcriptional regulator
MDTRTQCRAALPASQPRSLRTLESILAATEALLDEKRFEEISMTEIAARAGCAVGTIYRRVSSKEALLPCISERYSERFTGGLGDLLDRRDWSGVDLRGRCRELVGYFVGFYRRERGPALALSHRLFSEEDGAGADFRVEMTQAFERCVVFLAGAIDDRPRVEAEHAARLGFLTIYSAALFRIVFGASSAVRVEVEDSELGRELSQMLHAYLASPGAGLDGSPGSGGSR